MDILIAVDQDLWLKRQSEKVVLVDYSCLEGLSGTKKCRTILDFIFLLTSLLWNRNIGNKPSSRDVVFDNLGIEIEAKLK